MPAERRATLPGVAKEGIIEGHREPGLGGQGRGGVDPLERVEGLLLHCLQADERQQLLGRCPLRWRTPPKLPASWRWRWRPTMASPPWLVEQTRKSASGGGGAAV